MLDGLDAIDWAQLRHAYGPAGDVPAQLRALAGTDDTRRRGALHALHGNIWHQGTVYEATVAAAPFLIEIARARGLPNRTDVLGLVSRILRGQGYNAQHEDLTDEQTRSTPAWQDEKARQLAMVATARDAVIARLGELVELARSDDDLAVRIGALEVVRVAGPGARPYADAVRRLVEDRSDDRSGARALRGQALATWLATVDDDALDGGAPSARDPLLELVLAAHRILRRRRLEPPDRDALLAALDAAPELAEAYGQMAYRATDLATDVADLARIGAADGTLRDGLVAWLPRASGEDAATMVSALAAMLDRLAPSELSVARGVLAAWHRHEAMWAHAGRFERALRDAKLPWSRHLLATLLAAPADDVPALRATARALAFPPTILDRELARPDGSTETVADRWVQLMAHKGEGQQAAAEALAAALTGEEASEAAWLGPLQEFRGDATAAARALIAAAARRDPTGALVAITRHADQLIDVGAPKRVTPTFTSFLNAMFGVVLEGVTTVAEVTHTTPPARFDEIARKVADLATRAKMWRPAYARYLQALPADRAAALPEAAP